jgi:hypothetical protein
MNYTKPEVVLCGTAIARVQSQVKNPHIFVDTLDPSSLVKTNGAYEADE